MIYFAQKRHFINRLILLLLPIVIITIAGCGSGGSSSSAPSASTADSGDYSSSSTPNASTAERVVIRWTAPTLNADGSPLTDLAGYNIYYGPATSNYTGGSINVGLTTSYDTKALPAGYYCFVLTSYDISGNESAYSSELCKDLT